MKTISISEEGWKTLTLIKLKNDFDNVATALDYVLSEYKKQMKGGLNNNVQKERTSL
jgi:predicted CopG family antitoxin